MAIDVTVKPTLIYEHNGALHIRKYDYGDYLIKVVFDGVDTVTTVMPKDVLMPSLRREPNATFINFPSRSYLMNEANTLIEAINDLEKIAEKLDEIVQKRKL